MDADVDDYVLQIPVLFQSLKSSILNLTYSQMDQTFWGVVSAAVRRLGPWWASIVMPFPQGLI